MKKPLQIFISYTSVNGGVNNLQVAKVVRGYEIVQVFTSKIEMAKVYAERFLKSINTCSDCGYKYPKKGHCPGPMLIHA